VHRVRIETGGAGHVATRTFAVAPGQCAG